MTRLTVLMFAFALLAPAAAAQTTPTQDPAPEPAREQTPWNLTFDKSPLRIRPGGTALSNLTIQNDNPREYIVTIDVRHAPDAPLRAGVKEAQVRLPANATIVVPLHVSVAPGAPLGVYMVDVLVHVPGSDLHTPRSSTFLPVDVRTTPAPGMIGVAMMEPFPRMGANPGGAAEGNITIRALQAGTYALAVTSDPGIRVALSRDVVRVAAGDSTTVTIRVLVDDDENVTSGTHVLRVTALREGDEFAAPSTLDVPFEVSRPILLPVVDTPPARASQEELEAQFGTGWQVGVGLGVVGGGAAGFWLLRRRGWTLPFLAPLYTRIARNKVLEQPVREQLAKLVQDEPGITFSELQRRLGVAAGQLTHHARMLEDARVLFSTPDGQHRRFFHVAHGRVAAVPSLGERAMAALQARGPRTLTDLARELGVSKQALHYHTKRLQDDGLVTLDEDGRLVPVVRVGSAASPRTDAGG